MKLKMSKCSSCHFFKSPTIKTQSNKRICLACERKLIQAHNDLLKKLGVN